MIGDAFYSLENYDLKINLTVSEICIVKHISMLFKILYFKEQSVKVWLISY